MQNLVRASGRRVWYLNDPIEDNPNHDWEDYRTNWENTLTASLLQPEVWRYEIMPWPTVSSTAAIRCTRARPSPPVRRAASIRAGTDPEWTGLGGFGQRQSRCRARHHPQTLRDRNCSPSSAALGDMKQSNGAVGERGHAQYRRTDLRHHDVPARRPAIPRTRIWARFYGLAMPLVKHGVPVEPVQIESAAAPGFLESLQAAAADL